MKEKLLNGLIQIVTTMDELEKKILIYLFRDPFLSQRNIAKELGLTPPSLTYRIKKLQDEGVFQGYTVLVNPNFYGKYYGFVAFKNYYDYIGEGIFFKFKCLEWLNVYGVEGSSIPEIEDKIEGMKKILGDYSLKYFPKQEIIESKPYDLQIVKYLVRNPRAQPAEIAQETGLTQKLVEKRTKILLEKGIVKLIPIIDLKKTDVVMFSIFTRRVAETRKILDSCKILEINDGQAGIIGCITDRIENVRKYVEAVRNVADREADVMVIYDYQINSGFSL